MPRPDQKDQNDSDGTALEGMAIDTSTNQVQHEDMPASHEDGKDRASVQQNEESWRRSHENSQSVSHDAEHGQTGSAGQAVPSDRSQHDQDQHDQGQHPSGG
jgi:hypothetical protein